MLSLDLAPVIIFIEIIMGFRREREKNARLETFSINYDINLF